MEDVRTDLVEIMSLVKGNVERELLLRNEYLAAENEILRSPLEEPGKVAPIENGSS